ncbi:hydroxyphenylacetyl-CoA thioesterase PaaI [Roseospirillum parvum]|uniref:Acyl-CoA thioesterase n=1 Tax=Roseospirillum parvum TaxID=83401 RepID=A0A1G8E8W5_9PROT|nr:hydroxyphenylacetyl-CoA thioesterase PaaI [Roseospirillum parvum]SDH66099.1 acyl-CoA thioesterase [Roseospirillum parvum]
MTETPIDGADGAFARPIEQRIAEAVAQAMMARDEAAKSFGISIEKVGPGFARLTMPVRPDMLNGHATTHGGITFTLADCAFAYACNSHNMLTVAHSCSITYTAPGKAGDVLVAEAREASLIGRNGVYDVKVTNQHGDTLALFRGNSRTIQGHVFPPGDLDRLVPD